MKGNAMFMPTANAFRPAELVALGQAGLVPTGPVRTGGIAASALVETEGGWRPLGMLARGERVETWDGGLVEVAGVDRRFLWPAASARLIEVAAGALGNCTAFSVAPDQILMVDDPIVEDVLGAAGVLIRARDLVGLRGVAEVRPAAPVELVTLTLADEELLYLNTGALVLSGIADRAGPPLGGFLPLIDGGRAEAMRDLLGQGARCSDEVGRAA